MLLILVTSGARERAVRSIAQYLYISVTCPVLFAGSYIAVRSKFKKRKYKV